MVRRRFARRLWTQFLPPDAAADTSETPRPLRAKPERTVPGGISRVLILRPATQPARSGITFSADSKTIMPPWAGKHSRYAMLFEAFAVEVLQACRNVKAAAALLALSWDAVQTIMSRAVERGLERREATPIKHVGIDEKTFGTGHDSITVLTDPDGSPVAVLVPERTRAAAGAVLQTLSVEQRTGLRTVAAAMLRPAGLVVTCLCNVVGFKLTWGLSRPDVCATAAPPPRSTCHALPPRN